MDMVIEFLVSVIMVLATITVFFYFRIQELEKTVREMRHHETLYDKINRLTRDMHK